MLHNPLLHEVTISSMMFFLAALNAAASRRVMAAKRVGLVSYMFGKKSPA
jgi:O-antigen ligase